MLAAQARGPLTERILSGLAPGRDDLPGEIPGKEKVVAQHPGDRVHRLAKRLAEQLGGCRIARERGLLRIRGRVPLAGDDDDALLGDAGQLGLAHQRLRCPDDGARLQVKDANGDLDIGFLALRHLPLPLKPLRRQFSLVIALALLPLGVLLLPLRQVFLVFGVILPLAAIVKRVLVRPEEVLAVIWVGFLRFGLAKGGLVRSELLALRLVGSLPARSRDRGEEKRVCVGDHADVVQVLLRHPGHLDADRVKNGLQLVAPRAHALEEARVADHAHQPLFELALQIGLHVRQVARAGNRDRLDMPEVGHLDHLGSRGDGGGAQALDEAVEQVGRRGDQTRDGWRIRARLADGERLVRSQAEDLARKPRAYRHREIIELLIEQEVGFLRMGKPRLVSLPAARIRIKLDERSVAEGDLPQEGGRVPRGLGLRCGIGRLDEARDRWLALAGHRAEDREFRGQRVGEPGALPLGFPGRKIGKRFRGDQRADALADRLPGERWGRRRGGSRSGTGLSGSRGDG